MIIIGYMGETNAREYVFDISKYLARWPDATPDLIAIRPDGGQAYLADTEIDGEKLIWKINAYDTEIKGHGSAQLIFRKEIDGDIALLGKSEVMDVIVQKSIEGTEGADIPDPYETWVSQLEAYRDAAINAANEAQEASEKILTLTAEAETLAAGEPAVAVYDPETGKMIFGIPEGQKGDTGSSGQDGENGVTYTPKVSASGVISWTNDGGRENPQSIDIASAVAAVAAASVEEVETYLGL